MKHIFPATFIFVCFNFFLTAAFSQTKKVLFLGNSYTSVNNLPLLFQQVSQSTNDTVEIDSNTPGGYTLQGHSTNSTSLSKIAAGNWNFVVLQEQSQLPSFPDSQVIAQVFPYARFLDSVILQNNACAETVFYRTWGRKNGDASNCSIWPPVCTYQGMDSLLHLRYMKMATDNNAIVSPVGMVWKAIRQNHPGIELYASDGSHPSLAGSFAAACSFYTVIHRKNPNLISFSAGLPDSVTQIIKTTVKQIVFDSLSNWLVDKYDPIASFNYSITNNVVSFQNTTVNASQYVWDFGDNNFSAGTSPSHTYSQSGNYIITLTATNCGRSVAHSETVTVTVLGEQEVQIFPNPVLNELVIESNSSLKDKPYLLFNVAGQLVSSGKLNVNRSTIHMSALPSGCYYLKIAAEGMAVKKIIKWN